MGGSGGMGGKCGKGGMNFSLVSGSGPDKPIVIRPGATTSARQAVQVLAKAGNGQIMPHHLSASENQATRGQPQAAQSGCLQSQASYNPAIMNKSTD